MLHYNFDHCYQDEKTGVAACQAAIPADVAWAGILGILKKTDTLDRAPPLKEMAHG
jgi:hypothetical protein